MYARVESIVSGRTVYTHHMQGPYGECTEMPGSALGTSSDRMHSVPRACIEELCLGFCTLVSVS